MTMADITIGDRTTQSLVSALDGLSTRQRVINNNIANINTPGFKASEVSFAGQLAQAMDNGATLKLKSTDPGHLAEENGSDVSPQIKTQSSTTQRLDGNNVDLEKEMVSLTETVLQYQAVSKLVSRRLAMTRTVIYEGKR
jgi:flagellar basal-body rod protein FlgB